MKASAGQRVSK